MRCPRCGAENAERADRCYLCELPFTGIGTTEEPPAPEQRVQPQYPPQGTQAGMVLPSQQAVPPPGAPGPGYQPPPGAYQGGVQPPPPPPKGPNTVKIIVGALVALLVIIIGVGAFYLTRGKTYNIKASPPPGYQEASEELFDDFNETMKEGSEDIEVDELFVDNGQTNFIIVASMDMPPTIGEKPPSGDDPEEMEQWFYDNRDEWEDAFNSSFTEGTGGMGSVESDLFQVERLATGDAVLHMATTVGFMNDSIAVETLWAIKGRTVFFIALMGKSPSSQTVESLKESITFEE